MVSSGSPSSIFSVSYSPVSSRQTSVPEGMSLPWCRCGRGQHN